MQLLDYQVDNDLNLARISSGRGYFVEPMGMPFRIRFRDEHLNDHLAGLPDEVKVALLVANQKAVQGIAYASLYYKDALGNPHDTKESASQANSYFGYPDHKSSPVVEFTDLWSTSGFRIITEAALDYLKDLPLPRKKFVVGFKKMTKKQRDWFEANQPEDDFYRHHYGQSVGVCKIIRETFIAKVIQEIDQPVEGRTVGSLLIKGGSYSGVVFDNPIRPWSQAIRVALDENKTILVKVSAVIRDGQITRPRITGVLNTEE